MTLHLLVVLDRRASQPHPVRRTEVNSLGEIEALVEASMIGSWKRDHKLSHVLVDLVNGHAVPDQHRRIHYCNQVVQQVRRFLEQFIGVALHASLERLGVVTGHAVPGLCGAPVHVVDRVRPMVFYMPTEAGETHAHVGPGHFHPRDVDIHLAEDGLLHLR